MTDTCDNSLWREYWRESARPLASLLFVAPILLTYEVGVIWLGGDAVRNGADQWLRELLQAGGLGRLLLPLLTCGILIGWHHLRQDRWRLRPLVCSGMLLESLLLGLLLLLLATAHASWRAELALSQAEACRAVAYLGAGVYEELLFRLVLLPAGVYLFQRAGAGNGAAICWSIVLNSLLFAAAHHAWVVQVGGASWTVGSGEAWNAWIFAFRAAAGVFFSVVFLTRGFGIVVGAHAMYDLLVFLH